jgi:hypothetical protein
VLDPQGKAIQHALGGLGFEGVDDVRAGKIFELDVADSTSDDGDRRDVPQAARQHRDRKLSSRARMKTAVIVFPGSNCDRDIAVALEAVTGVKPQMVWHGESELPQGSA